MPHDTPLIATVVGGLVLAFIFGALANRLRMPAWQSGHSHRASSPMHIWRRSWLKSA